MRQGQKWEEANIGWAWTYQTEELTLLAMSDSRGLKAITSQFQFGSGKAILCHDAWRTYLHYSENLHQLCCTHLLENSITWLKGTAPQKPYTKNMFVKRIAIPILFLIALSFYCQDDILSGLLVMWKILSGSWIG